MTPEELTDKIERMYGFLAEDEKELIMEFIYEAKTEWESESYIKGFKDACNKTKEYLNEKL